MDLGLYLSTRSSSASTIVSNLGLTHAFTMGIPIFTACLYFQDSVIGRPSLHCDPAYRVYPCRNVGWMILFFEILLEMEPVVTISIIVDILSIYCYELHVCQFLLAKRT